MKPQGAGAAIALALMLWMAAAAPARAQQDKITFGTNWKAQAEHGGFYQALATGIYRKLGLDVTIRMGGPQVNHPQLLAAGAIDFNMGSNCFIALNYVEGRASRWWRVAASSRRTRRCSSPIRARATIRCAAMKGKPIMICPPARAGFWHFLRANYGFTDEQIRTYTFNMAPFLADKSAIQQGYRHQRAVQDREGGREVGRPPARRPRLSQLLRHHRSRRLEARATRSPSWCSASWTRRSRAGTAISTAIPRRPTR